MSILQNNNKTKSIIQNIAPLTIYAQSRNEQESGDSERMRQTYTNSAGKGEIPAVD